MQQCIPVRPRTTRTFSTTASSISLRLVRSYLLLKNKTRLTHHRTTLRRSRLQAELHALQCRNAELQKHTKVPQRNKPPPTQSQLNIKALCSDPTLSARVAEELERLGFSSSGSEEDDEQPSRNRGKKLRLKSGKTTKLTSRVVKPQLWPHSQLSLAYVSKTIAELSAGYASILKLPSLSET